MNLTFAFKHLDHSDSLQNYMQDQMDRVGTFLLKDGLGQVLFSKKNKLFLIEVSVKTPLKYFRAKATHFDPYSAVDEVVLKLEKQFLKNRKLNTGHKKFELSKEGRLNTLNDRFELKVRYRKAA